MQQADGRVHRGSGLRSVPKRPRVADRPLRERIAWWLTEVVTIFMMFYGIFEVGNDAWSRGLWKTSNVRAVSFCDSLYSMFRFANIRSEMGATALVRDSLILDNSLELGLGFFNKFASGTLVSYLYSETPVWIKSGRHIFSFLISFAVMHFWPYNLLSDWINRHAFVFKTALYSTCALYKLRKITFCMVHPAIEDHQWYLKVIVALVDLELSSTLRKFIGWWWKGCISKKVREILNLSKVWVNLKWAIRQYTPGLVAISLVGIGQRCWFCRGTTWVDLMGFGWSPFPAKWERRIDLIPEPFRPEPNPLLERMDNIWAYSIENLMHPIAIGCLLYRYLRQIDCGEMQAKTKTN